MSTITYRLGSSDHLGVRPLQPDGTVPDLTGVSIQLRIDNGGVCIPLDGAADGDALFIDLAGLDMPPRVYRAAIWFDWGDGWDHGGDLLLNVEGGC
ncbi:hypothetical protein [Paracoccus kondratievae]|uniref:Uncharacterized protein n=1 Tax=Paracoccus kondratievae TaxID=135740 RepID=A0AAD3RT84_9RHOB|nr:hypothetical protein [Paracoccus kondratievae]GLK63359.1 hypothetical protein GCM10017635_08290 [Paracoccus kondratievae]